MKTEKAKAMFKNCIDGISAIAAMPENKFGEVTLEETLRTVIGLIDCVWELDSEQEYRFKACVALAALERRDCTGNDCVVAVKLLAKAACKYLLCYETGAALSLTVFNGEEFDICITDDYGYKEVLDNCRNYIEYNREIIMTA